MTNQDPFRPQFHFTPPANWMNDPNGLVFYQGEYHLFYQYHPDSTVWGPMHWGHAVSHDLVNWRHLPVALYPDDLGTIFSGSVVIDWQNTAGFGTEAMVAIFTHHNARLAKEYQSVAYSLDKGRTWTKYAGNPVIPMPEGLHFFRDPKVFWHEESQQWALVLSAGDAVQFYSSPNLIDWTLNGRFHTHYHPSDGVWETPDLFQLPIEGGADNRWVLSVGAGNGTDAGRMGMKYFIGQFDGHSFTSDNPPETVLWADWGADFYAAQSWSGLGNDRFIWIGWLSSWRYAEIIPTTGWRGAMTLPRELSLKPTTAGIRLAQKPVAELAGLRHSHRAWRKTTISPDNPFIPDIQGDLLEIVAEFEIDAASGVTQLGIRLKAGNAAETVVSYSPQSQSLLLDRLQSGLTDFSPEFLEPCRAEMTPENDAIRLRLFVDRSSLELFGNDGLVSLSALVFGEERPFRLEFFAQGGPVTLNALEVYLLRPAHFLSVKGEET